MNPKEKYNSIIEMIEDCVQQRDEFDTDLIYHLARKNYMDIRDLTALFKFMLDETVKQYFVKRKLMASYKFIVESEKLDISTAINISGYDNHSSFNKSFKSVFGTTPKEAYKEKRFDLFVPPQTWDSISSDTYCNIANKTGEMTLNKKKFDISVDTYEKVLKIEELRAIYDLPELFEDFVQELVSVLKLSYEEAFRYSDALYDYCGDFTYDEEIRSCGNILPPVDELRKKAFDTYNQFIFFDCNLSIDAGFELEFETGIDKKQLMLETPKILAEYLEWNCVDHIDYSYFKNAYLFFQENATEEYGKENFDEYMTYVCVGMPKEIVFDELIPSEIDYDIYVEEDFELESEKSYAEEMDETRENWILK